MLDKLKKCHPKCEFFKCGQGSLIIKGEKAWCRFADDECDSFNCKYAQCIRGRLLNNGICGLSMSVKKVNLDVEDVEEPIRISKKLASKLKDIEFY